MLKLRLLCAQDIQSMHVYHRSCETVLAASSYQQQQQQVQDRLLVPASATTAGSMDAQRTLAFAVHTAVMGSVLTSAQTQAFVSGGIPCFDACGSSVPMDFSSRTSTPGPAKAGRSAPLQQQQVGSHLEDSTSPLSSDSLAVIGGVLTPCGADSICAARVGCKRSYDAVEQYQQVLQFKQTATRQQHTVPLAPQSQQTAQQAIHGSAKHAVLFLQQQAQQHQRQQQQLRLQQQAKRTLTYPVVSQMQQQQQQHHHLQALLAAGQHHAVVNAMKVAASAGSSRSYAAPSQQQLLLPQGSVTSTSSSGIAAPAISASWLRPQYVQQQVVAPPGAAAQQVPLLGSASSETTTSSTNSSSSCASLIASYLQQQRPAKRAATHATVATLLTATAAGQARALTAASSSSNNLQGLARQQAAAAAVLGPYRTLVSSNHGSGLLTWAGQILSCQLQDAFLLAQHIFKRVAGKLDEMLLISLGITVPVDKVTMLVSLWIAIKLEGHRRHVPGCSKLASALQLLPWAVTSMELHLMQLMNWQPYAGWALRPQDPSCVVTEY